MPARATGKSKGKPRSRPTRTSGGADPGGAILQVKRVYDPPSKGDGMRVLVDRLWPRGVSKAAVKLDLWTKGLAPSNALRQWYHRDPERFAEFRARYRAELAGKTDALNHLRSVLRGRTITLLTAAKDCERSHVAVLREVLARNG